jgi:tRNA (guanine37-N1)-methyltransferase
VEASRGEETKGILLSRGLLDTTKKVAHGADGIFFPLLPGAEGLARELVPWGRLVDHQFETRRRKPRDLREALAGPLDRTEIAKMGSSYDLVGRIAILELPEDLGSKKHRIGQRLLKWLPVDSVAAKASRTSGDRRIRGLEVIAGRNSLETTHRENGLRFRLDLSTVFYNPRLSGERARLAKIPTEGDLLIDMFAGVGPLSITIAKAQGDTRVYAVDNNRSAVDYLEENIRLNGTWNVVALCGDSRSVVRRIAREQGKADRIVMNLPASTPEFLPVAISALRPGGLLHYYRLASKVGARAQIEKELGEEGDFSIRNFREVESYSPSRSIYVADAVLKGSG